MKKVICAICIVLPVFAYAHVRTLVYTYDTDLLPSGFTEFEVWTTLRDGRTGQRYTAYDIRFEIEHAFTPNLSTDFYLDFTKVFKASPTDESHKTSFKGMAWAWIYRIPPLGFYAELYYYGYETEVEFKLLISKNFGNLMLAANIITESEFEFEGYDKVEEEGIFSLTGGLVYTFNIGYRNLGLGLEYWTHSEWPNRSFPGTFNDAEHHALFLGPVIHYSTEKIWATLGIYPQITRNHDEHEKFNLRMIIGLPL